MSAAPMPLDSPEPRDRPASLRPGRPEAAPSLTACITGVCGFVLFSALGLYALAWLGR